MSLVRFLVSAPEKLKPRNLNWLRGFRFSWVRIGCRSPQAGLPLIFLDLVVNALGIESTEAIENAPVLAVTVTEIQVDESGNPTTPQARS